MMRLELSQRGNKRLSIGEQAFTLIEILIYAAIVTGMITFSIFASYQLIDSADTIRHHKEVAENKKFFEQKIYWVLQNLSAINSPSTGATTTSLSVNKLSYVNNPVIVAVNNGVVTLKLGSNAANPITNEYVVVQNLEFHNYDFSGRPAIQISGTMYNAFASTSIDLNTVILTK
ncbi:MAG: hypothetical protein Q7S83_01275 [bacterium]|nr:hypothetical protein [bacterium]